MRKPTLKVILDFTFCSILIVFAVLIYSTYNRAQMVKQNRLLVNNVSNVNDVLEKVLSNSIDMETGARGFTITGEDDYLAVYRNGRNDARLYIDSLKELIKKRSMPLKDLPKLEALIASKDSISTITINTCKREGAEAAANIVKTGKGKSIMDSIRVSVMENQKEAIKILKENLRLTEENVHARNVNFTIFAVVTMIIIVFAYVKLRQNTKWLVRDRNIQRGLVNQLTVQNQQLNEFASIISHNLRSPAGNIKSMVATVDEDTTLEEYQMYFEMLGKISGSLNDSLDQLMEVLSIRRTTEIEKQTMRLQGVYEKTLHSLDAYIAKNEAVIKADFEKAPELNYSRIYLESIFHNLISNAIKYRKPDVAPEISLWTEKSGNYILLHVKDNGIGIDLNRHGHKLFGMNQRFTDHPDSKGVGLFMTKAQIESLGGKITAESEPGVGTTFTVWFLV